MKKVLLVILAAFLLIQEAQAQAPRLIPFQGRLTDSSGKPLPDGARLIQFQIYGEPAGGSPLWAGEVHRTTVNGGVVNVVLGSKNPLPADRPDNPSRSFLDASLYLQITVDADTNGVINQADPPLLPRQAILPVVFAQDAGNSRKLAGYDWSPIFGTNSPNGFIPGGKIQPQSIGAAQLGENSVTVSAIADQQITAAKLAPSLAADSVVPPGTIMAYAGDLGPGGSRPVPAGWLLCDGSERSRTEFARLFDAIDVWWGGGNGVDTFNLPDLRGYFLRGVDGGSGRDPDRDGRFTHGRAPNHPGSWQTDNLRHHTHDAPPGNAFLYTGGFNANTLPAYSSGPGVATLGKSGPISGDTPGDPGRLETRPINVYVHYIIKY